MQINYVYDPSVASAPTGFRDALNEAASIIDISVLNDPLTVTIEIGWGEVGGTPIADGTLAEAEPTGNFVSYDQLIDALNSNPIQSAVDQSFLSSLPDQNPAGDNIPWFISTAEQKALGLAPDPSSTEIDGVLGVNSNLSYTFTQDSGAISPDTFDLVGILEHEIAHALGRISNTGAGFYTPVDLAAYNEVTGQLQPQDGPPDRYFSVDGGVTRLTGFSSSSDHADLNGDTLDPFNAFLNPDTLYTWTDTDTKLMDVLGFQTQIDPAVGSSMFGNTNFDPGSVLVPLVNLG